MSNPLEQFAIKKIVPFQINGIDLSFTNSSLCMLITVTVVFFSLFFCLRKRSIIPSPGQSFAEMIYDFVLNIMGDTLGREGFKYVALIFTIFTFIACGNILGLFPYSFTFTSHLAAVGTLSVFCLLLNIFFGIQRRGLGYFHTFFPKGVPWIMAPLIVPVEIFSLIGKSFSLTIRLAVNMSIGHIILKIIGTFIIAMKVFGFIPMIADMGIIMFEIFVALLQAYIYTTLSCVYLSQSISEEE